MEICASLRWARASIAPSSRSIGASANTVRHASGPPSDRGSRLGGGSGALALDQHTRRGSPDQRPPPPSSDEIARLRSGIAQLHAELKGTASFESVEEWLKMTVDGDGRRHFVAKCEARDQPGTGNTLRFELRFDQTELPLVLASLDAVLAAFPVKGSTSA